MNYKLSEEVNSFYTFHYFKETEYYLMYCIKNNILNNCIKDILKDYYYYYLYLEFKMND